MLKKILEDMYVPEEILNNISEDDKQLLFLEIRKEQIRLYNKWESESRSSIEFHHKPNDKGLNIKFADDPQLVSYLGERPGDRPIEEILMEEKLRKAHEEAERAAQKELGENTNQSNTKSEVEDVHNEPPEPQQIPSDPKATVTQIPEQQKKPASEICPVVDRSVKSIEQRRQELVRRMSNEIYNDLLNQQNVLKETALKEHEQLKPIWDKAAEQARLDDELRRKKAVEARKFYANMKERKMSESLQQNDIKSPTNTMEKSLHLKYVLTAIKEFEGQNEIEKNKSDIKAWFLKYEWNKINIEEKGTKKVPDWFHGMISRQQCENLLSTMTIGSFLIRVSEKSFSFVLSYKATSKIKHILIHSKIDSDQYEFVGPPNVTKFKSLKDLIIHFQKHMINDKTCDILTTACVQGTNGAVDYLDLIPPK